MPLNKDALLRYRTIDQALRRKFSPHTSLADIQEICQQELGMVISERTLKEDIYRMRHDEQLGYFAPIAYSNFHRGYYYSDPQYAINQLPVHAEDMLAVKFAVGLLSKFKELPMLEQFAGLVDKLSDAVKIDRLKESKQFTILLPEFSPSSQGVVYLEPLMRSIMDLRKVSFSYQAFGSGTVKIYKIHPYLLREFRNRWYVLAWDEYSDKIKTFGLDRIRSLEGLDVGFLMRETFNPESYFKYSYGITYSDTPPQLIKLRFTGSAIHYVRSKPLHLSQEILEDANEYLDIGLTIQLSYELLSDILSYGKACMVLETIELKEMVTEEIKKMKENY